MEPILAFFEAMPVWQKAAWLVGVLGFFWILEGHYAFAHLKYKKWRHAKVNLLLLAFVMIINTAFGILTAGIFEWMPEQQWGLLYLVDWPIWAELLIALLVLDFVAQYGVHYLLHKVKWMWRLHLVHHSDTKVDATTGTRHHPFDFLIRESFALLAVLITGMPLAFYLLYRIVTVFFTYFTHANLKLPRKLDKAISYVFVTPVMHKFHHHHEMPWTDSNFGNMFSIWDRLFGTFVYEDPAKIVYGLDLTDASRDEDLGYQLRLPFDRQIKYKS
ncbi:sterol desaturase family protein [Croceiramulus getboli]|nr:sterol desaturase family protein [Flavobacteriaceae bacterium YJPT1-3]